MPTFTVVGTSSIATNATSDPQSWSVPVPSGTEVGDLLALGFAGGSSYTVTDSRLTSHDYFGLVVGGFGVADDLSDVTFSTTDDAPGLAIVIALRVEGVSPTPDGFGGGDYSFAVFGEQGGYEYGVAFVCDIVNGDPEDAADWTTEDATSITSSGAYYSLKAYSYGGGDPVPALYVEDSLSGGGLRFAFWLLFALSSAARRPFLRQRQSPRANPRVSLGRPQLRQRQRFL